MAHCFYRYVTNPDSVTNPDRQPSFFRFLPLDKKHNLKKRRRALQQKLNKRKEIDTIKIKTIKLKEIHREKLRLIHDPSPTPVKLKVY